ncbi:MAG: Cna B-type domain-containing protein [Eubacteriaceae bacterium]|nr:Cna B-type domain-containing protein [Eubacteriaceae bacterium]
MNKKPKGTRKGLTALTAMLIALALLMPSAQAAQIDIDSLKAGEVGLRTENVQMIQCGHEFSFDMALNAKFNQHVLDSISKRPYDVVLVIDRSGSMLGNRMAQAIAAARQVVDIIYDYNTGTGLYQSTGALSPGSGSKIGIATYSTSATSMSSSFGFSTATGALIDPSNSKDQIKSAIGTISASGNTNIAEGIRAAKDILSARTGSDKDRPAYIIVLSDGEANEPYNHTANAGHSTVSIGGIRIGDYLTGTLGAPANQACSSSISSQHTCNSCAAILRALEARSLGYSLYSVGFELTQGMYLAEDTLKKIAQVGNGDYYNANVSNIGDKFKDIVDTQITIEVNPVATNGVLRYNAPAGFSIESVTLSDTFKNGRPDPVISSNRTSFEIAIGDIYVQRHTVSVRIKASDTVAPGAYPLMGQGSAYSFSNVAQNYMDIPDFYSGSDPNFTINLAEWANSNIEVLPLAKAAQLTIPASSQASEFYVSAEDLKDFVYPYSDTGKLVGSGSFGSAGTYAEENGRLKITLNSAIAEGSTIEGTISYAYSVDGRTSCPAEAGIRIIYNNISRQATKIWNDNSNAYGTRPAEVSITLKQDGADFRTAKLSEANGWSYLFTGLPKYTDDGSREYIYSLAEAACSGYTSSVNGFTVTNTLDSGSMQVEAKKTWKDNSNAYGTRPSSVKLTLQRDGSDYESANLSGTGNTWSHVFTGLAKYSATDQHEYIYAVVEKDSDTPNLYKKSQSGNTITNTLETGSVEIQATKIWADNADAYGTRPSSVKLTLLRDGSDFASASLSGTGNTWVHTFTGLDKYSSTDQHEYVYTIAEKAGDVPAGYSASINGYTATNTLAPGSASVSAKKIWLDNSNAANTRPSSITIELLRDGAQIAAKELKAASYIGKNTWVYEFTGLEKYSADDQHEYAYSVNELAPPIGYSASIDGNTITNTLLAGETTLSVKKSWADDSNKYGTRPQTLKISLYQDGVLYRSVDLDSQTIDPAKNDWEYTFAGNMPKFSPVDQHMFIYTADEPDVAAGYKKDVNGSTITNTLLPGVHSVDVEKVWVDSSNEYGTRPDKVSIGLMQDGKLLKSVELDASSAGADGNSWLYTFDRLEKFSATDQHMYIYTVSETDEAPGYQKSQDGNTITNTLKPGETSISVSKHWLDNSNSSLTRPAKIEIALLQDGVQIKSKELLASEYQGANDWGYTFGKLSMYSAEDQHKYIYTVKELDAPEGYAVSQKGDDITNTLKTGSIDIKATKVWADRSNSYKSRPASVCLVLMRDGKLFDQAVVYASAFKGLDIWEHTFAGLDKYSAADQHEYIYEIDELEVPTGYSKALSADGKTVTNTLQTGSVSIEAKKVWLDDSNADKTRPNSITLALLRDGAPFMSAELKASKFKGKNTWEHTFANLDKYSDTDQHLYVYTVDEINVPKGYSKSVQKNGTTVVNTLKPSSTQLQVQKVWKDGSDANASRPGKVKLALYRDNDLYAFVELKAQLHQNSNIWAYTITGLQAYSPKDQHKYAYRIDELEVADGYIKSNTSPTVVTNTLVAEISPDTGDPTRFASAVMGMALSAFTAVMLKKRRNNMQASK